MGLLLFTGGTVVTPDGSFGADVPVKDEKFVTIGMDISEYGVETLDAHRKLIMSGFVEAHTPTNMPFGGTVTADDRASGTAATAVGGTTTIVDFALQEESGALMPVADIALRDPELSIAGTVENRHSNVDYTPYEGMTVTGESASVYVGGSLIYKDGEIMGERGSGKFIERSFVPLSIKPTLA